MKTIVCYGDSNTYGYNPLNSNRYSIDIIWTSVLECLFKGEYKVYNEGLNGRTTAFDREDEGKNGLKSLIPILHKYKQIDLLVFMLGTNDCLKTTNKTIDEIAEGMEKLIIAAKNDLNERRLFNAKIIIVVPGAIQKEYINSKYAFELDDLSVKKSNCLSSVYKKIAEKHNCYYLDCTSILEVSKLDCEHLTVDGHKKLAYSLFELINKI